MPEPVSVVPVRVLVSLRAVRMPGFAMRSVWMRYDDDHHHAMAARGDTHASQACIRSGACACPGHNGRTDDNGHHDDLDRPRREAVPENIPPELLRAGLQQRLGCCVLHQVTLLRRVQRMRSEGGDEVPQEVVCL